MKIASTAIGVVITTLVLTSHWFAHATHSHHQDRVITGVAITGAFFLAGVLAARLRKPKPAAPARTASPYYTGTRR